MLSNSKEDFSALGQCLVPITAGFKSKLAGMDVKELMLPRGRGTASDLLDPCQPDFPSFICCWQSAPILTAICMTAIYLVTKGTGRRKEKARKEKLWWNCHRVFLWPPLQMWARKGLPGRVLPGTSLADGTVNMGRDNPQPKGGTQVLGRPGLLLEMFFYPRWLPR